MNNIVTVFIPFTHVKTLLSTSRKKLFENFEATEYIEIATYIKPEEYDKLSDADLEKLKNIKLLEKEPVSLQIPRYKPEDLFPKEIPIIYEGKYIAESYNKKHSKKLHHYVPKKIFNPHFNTHKKGGR